MRIAFLSHQWPGARMGGIGSAVRATASAMAGAGHEVHVFTFTLPEEVRSNIPAGVVVHESPTLAERVAGGDLPGDLAAVVGSGGDGVYRLAMAWLLCDPLLRLHQKHPFDIVEAPEVEALSLPLLIQPDLNLPVVAHLHCCTAIAHLGNDTPVGEPEHLIRDLEFAAIAHSHARCAPTNRVVELTRQFTDFPADTQIIPHPVNKWDTPPNKGDIPPYWGLFVGRVEHLKGVVTLGRALNVFLARNPSAGFRFVGPDTNTGPGGGSMVEHLRSILDPSLLSRVVFTGQVDHDQIAGELDQCTFCVLPSLWENFSMACCEAMAAGKAVIVGAGTGSVEVVGDAGLVAERDNPVDLADKMETLLRNPTLRDDFARRAQQRIADRFAPAVIASQRANFYQTVIETSRHHAPPPLDSTLRALINLVAGLTGSFNPAAQTPGTRLLAIMDRLQQQTGRPAQIILYGAGKHTTRLLSERSIWERTGHAVIGILDDHPRFQADPLFLGLPVCSVAQATQTSETGDHPPVVLSTDTYQDQFWTQTAPLRALGVSVYPLYE